MCEPDFKSTNKLLQWPRSDATPDTYPTVNVKSGAKMTWWEGVDDDHPKYDHYKTKVAEHLSEKMGISPASKQKMDLPKDYKIFVHKQPQADGKVREDFYLYGSPYTRCFRSVPEFVPHAEWLVDTKRPLNDHTTCGCQYNKNSDKAAQKRVQSNHAAAKRQIDDEKSDPKRQKLVGKEDSLVVPERAIDFRSQRRFRRGELVWFRIEPISPPPNSGLPVITHWPGLLSAIVDRPVHAGQDAEASMSAAWTMAGAAPPDALQKSSSSKRKWVHSVRALGMFHNGGEIHDLETADLLPWEAGPELLGGLEGWHKIVTEADRTLNEGVEIEAREDPPTASALQGLDLEARWKKRWGERIRFVDMPRKWEAAVMRLAMAMQVGQAVGKTWSQTDKISIVPSASNISLQDVDDLKNNRKSLFQGLWLRGQRIWLDDMVMLHKHRSEIPPPLLGPSPGADTRAVFLKVRIIALEVCREDGKTDNKSDVRLMPQADSNGSKPQMWRCLFYGDLFELAEGEAKVDENDRDKKRLQSKAPKGYHFRCLNTSENEVVLDVFDIGGRSYGDLLEKDSYFCLPGEKDKRGRVEAGDTVMSLVGLRPFQGHPPQTTWKDDLYVIVRDATQEVERNARTSYAQKLSKRMGFNIKFDKGGAKSNGR